MNWDLAVVGLGPAGISCLKELENSGLKVIVFEKSEFPRKKTCAGGLTPKAYETLKGEFPGIDRVVRKKVYKFLLFNGEKEVALNSEEILTYLTDREELDYFLVSSLKGSSFDFHFGETVLSAEIEKDFVVLKTDKDSYRARILVDASGVNSRIVRQFGLKREIGFTYEQDVESEREDLIIDFTGFKWGYYWAFPKGGWVTTGLGELKSKSLIKNLEGKLKEFNVKHGFKGKIKWKGGFPIPAGRRKNEVLMENILFIGDAGGLVDPLTGEGIYYAAKSGIIAASVVKKFFTSGKREELTTYENFVNGEFGGEFFWARVVGKLFFPLRNFNLSVVERSERIANLTAGILSGKISYRRALFEYLKGVACFRFLLKREGKRE